MNNQQAEAIALAFTKNYTDLLSRSKREETATKLVACCYSFAPWSAKNLLRLHAEFSSGGLELAYYAEYMAGDLRCYWNEEQQANRVPSESDLWHAMQSDDNDTDLQARIEYEARYGK